MTVREEGQLTTQERPLTAPLAELEHHLTRLLVVDGEQLAYAAIFVLAVLTRFWDLGARVMSHDESLHTRYSWNLYRGEGFSHTPLMHGPLLFHMTALSYLLFGDNDFTSRIYPAVVGILVVILPYFMRRWLGRAGALAASFFFLISPLVLYYSRYIRHDMPAILGTLVMAIATWRYIEDRKFKYLVWLAVGQIVLFASKEVSFIYIAIFGSFITLYFINRLLSIPWNSSTLRRVFIGGLAVVLLALVGLGIVLTLHEQAANALPGVEAGEAETVSPADPDAPADARAAARPPSLLILLLGSATITGLVTSTASVIAGQWRNLRRFPELDVAMAMGTLILPALTPFLIHFAGYDPMDTTEAGVARSLAFTLPVLATSVLIGLIYFMKPPEARRVRLIAEPSPEEREELDDAYDPATNTLLLHPDIIDWLGALFTSRWWAIGGPYWLIFIFFFTTMFTNGNGIGTGLIGSLGYWLEQQGVRRGQQPWYYYIMVLVPVYEFLPLILSLVAGAIGLRRWLSGPPEAEGEEADIEPGSSPQQPDLDVPIRFPVLLFIGYWAAANFVAYSIAGEKMPWLTTHLTTPMILLAGWVVGQLVEHIEWRRLLNSNNWLLLALIPLLTVALLRTGAPLCKLWAANPLCNTIIPPSYQAGVFEGHTVEQLAATGEWMAAAAVALGTAIVAVRYMLVVGAKHTLRLASLLFIGWLTFLTARAAWRAAYINYDYPTEFLVYAHSSGAVKDVMERIEEISFKTTDGRGLRVAYDNRVSWPMSWYLRDYYNAVYFGDQPSRGLIGDAPVILAGPSNWPRVESLLGNRYYQFEYIRMWWPMQDYFGYEGPSKMLSMFRDVLRDPALQRGLWEIWYNREYDAYADAVAPYRNDNRPNFELSQWPVPDRMRVYIRKDVFAQVWNYGVAASEIAEVVDPYAAGVRNLVPSQSYGEGLLNRPHGIALGPDGRLYVADSGNHRIAIFDREGNLIQAFGAYGLAPQSDAFNEPWDVAVGSDGTVYVADTWNHRIAAYDAEGRFRAAWGFEGPSQIGSAQAFWGPRGVTVDSEGRVYVADTGNKRIMVFNRDGQFLRQIGGPGGLQGELDEPVGLDFGPDGLLYVADTWNQRVQVFSSDGLSVREWLVEAWFGQSNERPYLAVDAQGTVYVTDPDASRVIVFNGMGEYLYSFGDYITIGLAGGILVDDEGHLYLSDTERGAILRYDIPAADQTTP